MPSNKWIFIVFVRIVSRSHMPPDTIFPRSILEIRSLNLAKVKRCIRRCETYPAPPLQCHLPGPHLRTCALQPLERLKVASPQAQFHLFLPNSTLHLLWSPSKEALLARLASQHMLWHRQVLRAMSRWIPRGPFGRAEKMISSRSQRSSAVS